MRAILAGSYRYGTNDVHSDHNYLAFVAEDDVEKMKILLESNGYRLGPPPFKLDSKCIYIHGDTPCSILGIIVQGPWTCFLFPKPGCISDRQAIINDRSIYRIMRIDDIIPDNGMCSINIIKRIIAIKKWARDHGMYGGSYPNGAAYMMYAINTYKKGYSYDMIFKNLHVRSLYLHPEQGDLYIQSVPDSSFIHLKDSTPI